MHKDILLPDSSQVTAVEVRGGAVSTRVDPPEPPGHRLPGGRASAASFISPAKAAGRPPDAVETPGPDTGPDTGGRDGRGVVVRGPGRGGGGPLPVTRQYRNKWPRPQGREQGLIPLKSIVACEKGGWHLHLVHLDTGEEKRVPFRCRSWRHAGDCRQWKGAQDFVRIREALRDHPQDWTYIVLTFDQSKWKNEWAAYRGAIHCWARLRKRLTRAFGRIGYIQTWERNVNSPFPHVNIVVNNATLARLCAGDGGKKFHSRWLTPNAVRCGFGKVTYAQGMKSADAMAGYMTKLAKELTGAGEKNQIPTNAPKHFRRIRASRGMLPPVHKTGDWTGELVQMPVEAWNELSARLKRYSCPDDDPKGVRVPVQDHRAYSLELDASRTPLPPGGGRSQLHPHDPRRGGSGVGGPHAGCRDHPRLIPVSEVGNSP